MRKKIISTLLCVTMLSIFFGADTQQNTNAEIIVTEEWVANFDMFGGSGEHALAIATDPFGNVYVTGHWFVTIKYDTFGNVLWIANVSNSECIGGHGLALDVDSLGNVYVTGEGIYDTPGGDFLTVKYDPLGNELWRARYDGPKKVSDVANAIAVDSSGNVYVTGKSSGVSFDFTTIAYDSFGNELWVARYNGPSNDHDKAWAIAVDELTKKIYVTGWSYGKGTSTDYATIAYDSSGNELWVARYNGPDNCGDHAWDLSIDKSGHIYVTGESYSANGRNDITTVAYDSLGNELWVARYDFGVGYAISAGPAGNIYVTGSSFSNDTHFDYTTLAYGSTGDELWVAKYNGPGNLQDTAYAIAIDSSENVYITGKSDSGLPSIGGTDFDFATVAYNSMGSELWVTRYNGPDNRGDRGKDIAIDPFGNVYVTGVSTSDWTADDYCTIKYSQHEPILQPTIDIDPDTLNLKSKGRWISCYIDLPGYDVNDIDISTIMLEDTIPAEWGDIQGDTLMVKFDRSEVEDMLSPGTYNLKVTGEFTDGTKFEGFSDEIRVIDPP